MHVKCSWCSLKDDKETMICDEKSTGKLNKNGTEKKIRKYYHEDCYIKFLEEKKFKENEVKKFDDLYQYLLKLHNFKNLDVRMIEKIQDLRNGTIKINNKKVKRYKSGVEYEDILKTYQYLSKEIENALHIKRYDPAWNQFSYVFGIVQKKINDVKMLIEQKQKQESIQYAIQNSKINNYSEENNEHPKTKKDDELDISEFL